MANGAYRNALLGAGTASGFGAVEAVARALARQLIGDGVSTRPSHVLVQDYALAPVAAALQELLPALCVVAACHLPVFAGFTYFDKPVGDAMHQVLEAKLVHLADRVIVPSRFAAGVLTITHNVAPGKLVVLPLGVHRPAALVPPPAGPLRLLAIGRPTEQKGHHFLFEALRDLLREDPGTRLTVVTGDRNDQRIAALGQAFGVAAQVDVAPPTAPDAIWPLIDRHDMLVTTSLYETFGLAVLEAMASRRPTVGFAVGALTELWGGALSADFATPLCRVDGLVARIRALVGDPERCRQLGHAAWRRAQEFSWEAHVDRLLAEMAVAEAESGEVVAS